jgi:hypothetical protein
MRHSKKAGPLVALGRMSRRCEFLSNNQTCDDLLVSSQAATDMHFGFRTMHEPCNLD